jgi:LacI family transcriptional regulator, repressor for deo operon, udp, cdd, tsx, nupC, and nupG
MKKPRLRHVAELAGVSQATVSRVLNGKAGVAATTRREVLLALQQLGYEPTGLKRTRRTGLVGLIVPELDNPVFPRFAQAIESLLASHGLITVLCTSTPSGMSEADYLDVLLDQSVTGIVIISGTHADTEADHTLYHELASRRLPTVLVNGTVRELGLPSVTVDHAEAAKMAVAHLTSLGHSAIGLALGPHRYLPSLALIEGYRIGLEEAGLEPDERRISETLYSIEGGHAAGGRLIEVGTTGIVCASDHIALGVIRAAREAHLRVPADLSVIGFDDAGSNAYVDPPLTSVQQQFEPMAEAIVHLLTQAIGDPETAPHSLIFRPELIVRASTGAAPPVPLHGTSKPRDRDASEPAPIA